MSTMWIIAILALCSTFFRVEAGFVLTTVLTKIAKQFMYEAIRKAGPDQLDNIAYALEDNIMKFSKAGNIQIPCQFLENIMNNVANSVKPRDWPVKRLVLACNSKKNAEEPQPLNDENEKKNLAEEIKSIELSSTALPTLESPVSIVPESISIEAPTTIISPSILPTSINTLDYISSISMQTITSVNSFPIALQVFYGHPVNTSQETKRTECSPSTVEVKVTKTDYQTTIQSQTVTKHHTHTDTRTIIESTTKTERLVSTRTENNTVTETSLKTLSHTHVITAHATETVNEITTVTKAHTETSTITIVKNETILSTLMSTVERTVDRVIQMQSVKEVTAYV